jgi:hypothetical protein
MDWQKRLYDHEESPPPEAWEAIREDLSSHPSELGRKLGAMEAQPPEAVWGRIRTAVGQASDAKPVEGKGKPPVKGSFRSIPSRAFAYAASLAGIGLFLSAVYWYQTDRRSQGALLGGANPFKTGVETNQQGSPSNTEDDNLPVVEEAASDSVFPLRFTQVGKSSEPGMIELCDSRGDCIAVSSKMRDLTESMRPAVKASASGAVKSRKWNRTLKRWQKRLQNSQYLPNPGNLFDLSQLAELLNDRP